MNCSMDKNVINRLWAVMLIKFPTTWESAFFKSPFKPDGNLTNVAIEWDFQLSGLTTDEIKSGIDALVTRTEKRFPPNAMEFKALCIGEEWENVADAIFDRLHTGNSYEWENQLAFNCWAKWSFEYQTSDKNHLPKLIQRHIRIIDRDSMIPLPDYTQPAIEKPPEPTKSEREKQEIKKRFFAAMSVALVNIDKLYPEKFVNLMNSGRGWEIVKDFLNKGYKIPDKVKKNEHSPDVYKSLFGNVSTTYIKAMTKYLAEITQN